MKHIEDQDVYVLEGVEYRALEAENRRLKEDLNLLDAVMDENRRLIKESYRKEFFVATDKIYHLHTEIGELKDENGMLLGQLGAYESISLRQSEEHVRNVKLITKLRCLALLYKREMYRYKCLLTGKREFFESMFSHTDSLYREEKARLGMDADTGRRRFFSKCAELLRSVSKENLQISGMLERKELPQSEDWHRQAEKFAEFKRLYDRNVEVVDGKHRFIDGGENEV